MKLILTSAFALTCLAPNAFAQKACARAQDAPLAGVVRDDTQAMVPGATVRLDGAQTAASGSDGRFRFGCVAPGKHKLSVNAAGFAEETRSVDMSRPSEVGIVLRPEAVVTDVTVNATDSQIAELTPTASGPSQTISGDHLQTLADDPDDLLRELQQLSARPREVRRREPPSPSTGSRTAKEEPTSHPSPPSPTSR